MNAVESITRDNFVENMSSYRCLEIIDRYFYK